ncbi:hypothetical protein UN717_10275 [Streptococcus suis]|uniref:hypothetical protein n=1 Tax=Streptococcus suis TaxID=1307 RepID=UPI002A7B9796|nr:hypothetical protein [Streptococcus suis]MDY7601274.1 hypothetical protein [Streptococcus suis]HEL1798992.1 hypothetical protein [Streptococcus suis]
MMTFHSDFDEKMKQLKEESIAEFSLVAGTIGEARELIESVKSNGIKWFSGEPIEHMSEYIYKKMQTYPEKRFVLNFRNGFNLKKQLTIFCTWEQR